jgi:hypothetical protein
LIDTLYSTWKNIPLRKYENTSQGISGATFSPPATPPCGGTSVGLYHITLFYCSSASSRTCRGGFETTARTSFPVIGFDKTLQFLVQATFRRPASYVDRMLRGAKPGDTPVQLPMGNRKTERLGGLEVQDHRRAD